MTAPGDKFSFASPGFSPSAKVKKRDDRYGEDLKRPPKDREWLRMTRDLDEWKRKYESLESRYGNAQTLLMSLRQYKREKRDATRNAFSGAVIMTLGGLCFGGAIDPGQGKINPGAWPVFLSGLGVALILGSFIFSFIKPFFADFVWSRREKREVVFRCPVCGEHLTDKSLSAKRDGLKP